MDQCIDSIFYKLKKMCVSEKEDIPKLASKDVPEGVYDVEFNDGSIKQYAANGRTIIIWNSN